MINFGKLFGNRFRDFFTIMKLKYFWKAGPSKLYKKFFGYRQRTLYR